MAAIGLSLIFGTTGLVNFAHGELVTYGAILAFIFNVTIGWPMLLAAPIAIALATLTGSLVDRGFWRPLRNRGTGLIAMMVISIGVGLLVRYIFLFQFTGFPRGYREFSEQTSWEFGPLRIVPRDLWTIVISLIVLLGVALFIQRNRMGKAMRAVSDNRDLAESSGIDVDRVINFVWAAGAGLAAFGGILHGLSQEVTWQMGFQLLLLDVRRGGAGRPGLRLRRAGRQPGGRHRRRGVDPVDPFGVQDRRRPEHPGARSCWCGRRASWAKPERVG